MTLALDVSPAWKDRIVEVVHEDGAVRVKFVTRDTKARYYELIEERLKHTGNGVMVNTSLNHRGTPMVCSPTAGLSMFFGSGLQYLIIEDVPVTKEL